MPSLVKRQGRTRKVTVRTMPLSILLAVWLPTTLKVDIEGGEYELPLHDLPDCVKTLHLELHTNRGEWGDVAAPRLVREVEAQGFVADRPVKIVTYHLRTWGTWRG